MVVSVSDFDNHRVERERQVDWNRQHPTSEPSSGRGRHAGKIVLGIIAAVLVVFVILVATDDGASDDAAPSATLVVRLASVA